MTAYGDSTAFKAYHTDRGRTIDTDWSDADIDAALLLSAEWLDGAYEGVFVGYKTGGYLQDRSWPRQAAVTNTTPPHVFLSTDIPDKVVQAAYEATFRQLTTPGSLEVDYTPGKYMRVAVDGAITVDYARNVFDYTDIQLQIGAIDRLLWPLLECEAGSRLSGGSYR